MPRRGMPRRPRASATIPPWEPTMRPGSDEAWLGPSSLPGTDLLQIPPTLMDGAVFYSAPTRSVGEDAIRTHLRSVFDLGGAAVLNWHLEQSNPTRLHQAGPALAAALDVARDRGNVWITTPHAVTRVVEGAGKATGGPLANARSDRDQASDSCVSAGPVGATRIARLARSAYTGIMIPAARTLAQATPTKPNWSSAT